MLLRVSKDQEEELVDVPLDAFMEGDWEEVTFIGGKGNLIQLFEALLENVRAFEDHNEDVEILLPKIGEAPWGIVTVQNDVEEEDVMILYREGTPVE